MKREIKRLTYCALTDMVVADLPSAQIFFSAVSNSANLFKEY